MPMKIQDSNYLSALQLQEQFLTKKSQLQSTQTVDGLSFQELLQQKATGTNELKFSKHASIRLEQRGISLTDNQMNRLEDGTQKAKEKGIRDSLVIVDELAFIVNVPNSTVVTAMDRADTATNVFTNIDGAVIM